MSATTISHAELAEFLWKIADLVKDDYEAKDYEDVILPFTLLRRLDFLSEMFKWCEKSLPAQKSNTNPSVPIQ